MHLFIYVVAYLAIIVFLAGVIKKIAHYISNPIHVRWELYPIPHEAKDKVAHGGGYLEEVDWWKKPRHSSFIGEMSVMIPEIIFLKAVWEHNRPLWFFTYPFHLGLYFVVGFVALLFLGVIGQLAGAHFDTGLWYYVAELTKIIGPIGFIMTAVGAAGLFLRRVFEFDLRNYSSFEHYFNLVAFVLVMAIATLTWLIADPNFELARGFLASLITFSFNPMPGTLFAIQIVLAVIILAYIPLTHMSHFFMKYFLYHDIRWKDTPNIDTPETDQKIGVVLNYPITWSAPHIAIPGKKTWAEVATFNPAQPPENK